MSFLGKFFKQPAKPPSRARNDAPRGTGSDRLIPTEEVDAFLDQGELIFVSSSHITAAQYFPADEKLMIEYDGGAAWLYSPVSRIMAEGFAESGSKGTWVYDNIRVRGKGNVHAHQVNAVQLR